MSTRSALAGAVTTAALVAALGSPAAVEAAREADSRTVGRVLTGFADWDVRDLSGDATAAAAIRLAGAAVLVTALCAVAGRARSRGAGFLAGWAALVLATAVAGAAAYLYELNTVLDGRTFGTTLADRIVASANDAALFGLWTGWFVGLAVALTTRRAATAAARDTAARAATAPAARRIAEPPPPWWAPTTGESDGTLRPGPTVFLPGGGHTADAGSRAGAAPARRTPPPVVPEATYEMTTVSGDPHPSDPDATRPVGMPRPADAGATPGAAGARDGADPADERDAATADTGHGADATTASATTEDRDAARPAPPPDT